MKWINQSNELEYDFVCYTWDMIWNHDCWLTWYTLTMTYLLGLVFSSEYILTWSFKLTCNFSVAESENMSCFSVFVLQLGGRIF